MDQTLSNFGNVFAFLALGVVFVAGGVPYSSSPASKQA